MAEQLTPRDAQLLWASRRIPNDQFLLFGFDGAAPDPGALPAWVGDRARRIPDLRLRVRDVPGGWDYPYWVPDDTVQIVEQPDVATWPGLQDALGGLTVTRLDPWSHAWRLHIYRDIADAPGCAGPATVAVLQVSHALADGQRASAVARALFGPAERLGPPVGPADLSAAGMLASALVRTPVRQAATVVRGLRAWQVYRRHGEPPRGSGMPLSPVNRADDGGHAVRMLVFPAAVLRVPGATVTAVALTAIGAALRSTFPGAERLGAEVTVAGRSKSRSRNNFRNVGIDLRIGEPDPARLASIGADLRAASAPVEHPLSVAQRRVSRALPAPLLRREVAGFPLDAVPATVTGNTVVSSVHRGPADLCLGDAPVRFTAGFPALSPVMGLTHGVHGLGDTVTVSVHAASGLIDVDRYVDELSRTLRTPSCGVV